MQSPIMYANYLYNNNNKKNESHQTVHFLRWSLFLVHPMLLLRRELVEIPTVCQALFFGYFR